MGIRTDYFMAGSDDEAAGYLSSGVSRLPADALCECRGIEPWVMLATLQEIVTGTPYDEIADADLDVAERDEVFVVRVRPELAVALSTATSADLAGAAQRWSETEELSGSDPDGLADFLHRLAELARTTAYRGHHMYCWVSS